MRATPAPGPTPRAPSADDATLDDLRDTADLPAPPPAAETDRMGLRIALNRPVGIDALADVRAKKLQIAAQDTQVGPTKP
jgi:hypothetical protein